MTLAELTQKVENALKDSTPFTEQVKVTLQVVAEQLNALKTLDGYYTENLEAFTQLTAQNQALVKKATELLAIVEQTRDEAEAIINKRIDELGTNVEYKSLIKITTKNLVFYAGEAYIPKENFTASTWEIDKNKLIKIGGSSADTPTSSNVYESGKVINKGDVITYENKLYIATESFTATSWENDSSKFIAAANDEKLEVDLSNYYNKDQINLLLEGKCDLLTPGTGVEVTQQDGNIIVGVKDYDTIKSDIAEIAKTINTGISLNKKQFSLQIDLTKIGDKSLEPSEFITATDEAKGASYDEILEWAGVYPLVLSPQGIEFDKLNANDYSKFTNGGDASQYIITLGNDVMVKHPLRGRRMRRLSSQVAELSLTDDLNAKDFTYNAFYLGGERKDCFYMGAYEGFVSGGKLYSTSGQYPAVNTTLGTFRNYAQARGAGYNLVNYEQWMYYQALWLLTHQALNSQKVVGMGNCSTSGALKTGFTNDWGKDSEFCKKNNPTFLTDGKHSIKSNYIENPWGNVWEWRDGFLFVGTKITTAVGNFNDAGLGYTDRGYAYPNGAANANIASVAWDNERGFYPTQVGGDKESYFTDSFWQSAGCSLFSGGDWDDGSACGVFCLDANNAASSSSARFGARLVKM